MNDAGGERGDRLTLFATVLLACSGSAYGGEGATRNAGGLNEKCSGTVFKTWDGRLVHLCVLVIDLVLAEH